MSYLVVVDTKLVLIPESIGSPYGIGPPIILLVLLSSEDLVLSIEQNTVFLVATLSWRSFISSFLCDLVIRVSSLASFVIIAISPFLVLVGAPSFTILVTQLLRTKGLFPSNFFRSSLKELTQVPYGGLLNALTELPIFLKSRGYDS